MSYNDKIVERYYFKNVAARTGKNKELQVTRVKKQRKIGVQYELYSHQGNDPNMYMLIKDANYNRLRVRKITVYFDSNQNLREHIENDYPLSPSSYDNPKYDFRPWWG